MTVLRDSGDSVRCLLGESPPFGFEGPESDENEDRGLICGVRSAARLRDNLAKLKSKLKISLGLRFLRMLVAHVDASLGFAVKSLVAIVGSLGVVGGVVGVKGVIPRRRSRGSTVRWSPEWRLWLLLLFNSGCLTSQLFRPLLDIVVLREKEAENVLPENVGLFVTG
jgi:hypothetical protein